MPFSHRRGNTVKLFRTTAKTRIKNYITLGSYIKTMDINMVVFWLRDNKLKPDSLSSSETVVNPGIRS
jgi:hypothetical protein